MFIAFQFEDLREMARKGAAHFRGFAQPCCSARTQQDRAFREHERRVLDEDGVRKFLERR